MSVTGTYKLTINTPGGTRTPTLTLKEEGGSLSGTIAGQWGTTEFGGGTVDGNGVKFSANISAMGREIALSFDGTIEGDSIGGSVNTPRGKSEFTGTREG
jgi:hypothetical protein